MPVAALEVEIINKVSNIGAFAEERAAMAGALSGGGFTPLGGGTVNFGGSLTRDEQALAAAQMATFSATQKSTSAFKEYETQLKNATIVSGEAGAITDGLARKMSALGNLGITPMSVGLIGAVVGVAGLVEAGRSLIDNAEKQEEATRSLAQAYRTLGEEVPTKVISDFIDKNARFVGNMYDAEQGFASLARAGFNNTMQLRLMNDALDLTGATGKTLSQSITVLTSSSTGMSRGLLELGISQREINAAMAKGSTEAEKFEALLKLLESRIAGARNNINDTKQASSELSVTWDKISNDNGPGLAHGLAVIIGKTDDLLNSLRSSDWSGFNDVLVSIAKGFNDVGTAIDNATRAWNAWAGSGAITQSTGIRQAPNIVRGQQLPGTRQRGFILTSN